MTILRRLPRIVPIAIALCLASGSATPVAPGAETSPPKVGAKAESFTLEALDGETVSLDALRAEGPVVLTVLRGYPGYQCPICSRQVGELLSQADAIAELGARVVLVYPGPNEALKARAEEFVGARVIPEHFEMVLDPGYTFTNAYGLRWDAPQETAYPSTFVIGPDGIVRYAKVSQSHGGRAPTSEVLEALRGIK